MSTWDPYPYQERVAQQLLEGRSVILQAPTGAGKTAAALLPFLHARRRLKADQFPRKCIYSVPMRVLANQFEEEYRKHVRRFGWEHELSVAIQTGDRPDDPKAESDLVFTTIDQTLSNFLNIPYALGTGSANLNAGAILASYLVFDELHLYDPDTTLPTTLEMLRLVKDVTPFVVMTATFSSQMLQRLADLLDAVIVPEDEEARSALEQIGSQVGKTRRFHPIDAPLTAETVLENRGRRTICICNTVSAAQELYRDLKRMLAEWGDDETEVCLLHSRFYKKHRDTKEDWIRDRFGIPQDEYDGPPLIVVATQVIEVGVDATCDVMHTEMAPASSLLQRAGRCARREHETGDVYIYLPRDDDGDPDFTPYALKSKPKATRRGRQLCEATWKALHDADFDGWHMSFEREQALIDRVHTPVDEEILDGIAEAQSQHRERMFQTMQTVDYSAAPELIRDIDSRYVIIHPDPNHDEHLMYNPWYYDGFSFHPGTLAGAYNQLLEQVTLETPWIMQSAQRADDTSAGVPEEAPARQPKVYRWGRLVENDEVFQTPVVAVHPSVARYDEDLGIVFELSGEKHTPPARDRDRQRTAYSYERETYAEHVAGLYRAYRESIYDPDKRVRRLPLADETAYVVRRLEESKRFRLSDGALGRVLRALFACHDLGKLSTDWQAWAHAWQERVGQFFGGEDMSLPAEYMAAHTDYQPTEEQRKAQKRLGRRPAHAAESAVAAFQVLEQFCDDEQLWKAAMTAIARHHYALTENYSAFMSHAAAPPVVQEALDVVELPANLTERVEWDSDGFFPLTRAFVSFTKMGIRGLLLYFLLIRVLRLADQRSQYRIGR